MRKTSITKSCEACGGDFSVQAYRAEKSRFCSMECLWSGRKKRPLSLFEHTCAQCGAAYRTRERSRTFCSKRCGGLATAASGRLAQARTKIPKRPKMPETERKRRKSVLHQRYYEKNRDKFKTTSAERYSQKKDECKAAHKAWRGRNAAKLRSDNIRKRQENGEVIREARCQHYRDNSARYKAQSVARREHIRMATPPWADLKKIEAIYAEAERITIETGILHHVDHFYPLRGKTMCGLHVEGNLRIIPKLDNLRKSNGVPDEILVPRESALRVSCRNREGLETVLSPAGP